MAVTTRNSSNQEHNNIESSHTGTQNMDELLKAIASLTAKVDQFCTFQEQTNTSLNQLHNFQTFVTARITRLDNDEGTSTQGGHTGPNTHDRAMGGPVNHGLGLGVNHGLGLGPQAQQGVINGQDFPLLPLESAPPQLIEPVEDFTLPPSLSSQSIQENTIPFLSNTPSVRNVVEASSGVINNIQNPSSTSIDMFRKEERVADHDVTYWTDCKKSAFEGYVKKQCVTFDMWKWSNRKKLFDMKKVAVAAVLEMKKLWLFQGCGMAFGSDFNWIVGTLRSRFLRGME
ncbi:hypothetical protein CTI12_AA040220 [Artemisia annua]|uniref:Uncharacterized protein n=1 Tax=Artemisia annua TaxID=35608 RepID=A0A2U1QEG1_ARTAN|nr:hypothetical protein CTI12_AA040220 [Artemisia annua]